MSKNSSNFSLIHAHFLDNGFIGATLKHLYGRPLIVTAHGSDAYDTPFRDSWYRTLARYILGEADQVITVSRYNSEKLLSLGLSSHKLHVIPNGYDEKIFKPIPSSKARKEFYLPSHKKVLLSIGNLVDAKGHTHMIDAMRIVLKKRDDVILVIVGLGPLKEKLQKKTNELGLDEKIFFVGWKNHEEIPAWLSASDLFVLPSLSEGFPTVIPEAMACGKPVIATEVGGIPEIISNREVGLLVNPKDPEELALAILDALDKKWDSEIIMDRAKHYSWSNLVPQIISVYEDVL